MRIVSKKSVSDSVSVFPFAFFFLLRTSKFVPQLVEGLEGISPYDRLLCSVESVLHSFTDHLHMYCTDPAHHATTADR